MPATDPLYACVMAKVGEVDEESKETKIKDQICTIYETICGVVFKAGYLGKRHMTKHLRRDATVRPVYRIISSDFEEKLASIVKQVKALDTTKDVWRGISGPPDYDYYWLWASEDSEGDEFESKSYQVTKIDVNSFSYDAKSDYSFFVNMDVEEV